MSDLPYTQLDAASFVSEGTKKKSPYSGLCYYGLAGLSFFSLAILQLAILQQHVGIPDGGPEDNWWYNGLVSVLFVVVLAGIAIEDPSLLVGMVVAVGVQYWTTKSVVTLLNNKETPVLHAMFVLFLMLMSQSIAVVVVDVVALNFIIRKLAPVSKVHLRRAGLFAGLVVGLLQGLMTVCQTPLPPEVTLEVLSIVLSGVPSMMVLGWMTGVALAEQFGFTETLATFQRNIKTSIAPVCVRILAHMCALAFVMRDQLWSNSKEEPVA